MVAFDAGAAVVAVWSAVSLRLGTLTLSADSGLVSMALVAGIVVPPVFYYFGLYREITRYIGSRFALQMGKGVAVATLIMALAMWALPELVVGFPRSSIPIAGMVILLVCSGARLCVRSAFRRAATSSNRVAIYGAGDVGAGLVAVLAQDRATKVVALFDENPSLVGGMLRGIPVFHADDIHRILRNERIGVLLVALGSGARRMRGKDLQRISAAGVQVLTVPTLDEIGQGMVKIDHFRPLAIADLLGRTPVQPQTDLLERCVRGCSVLITGAGGSIGSELCRQALRHSPRRLIVLDNCEFGLFQIEHELRRLMGQAAPGSAPTELVSYLASVTDAVHMDGIIGQHQPDTIYHAAAYKHVPIVEENEVVGVDVNVLGTYRVSDAAFKHTVKNFVFISTDKAVRPTSVMGASKRLAEIVLQSKQAAAGTSGTRVSIVRFGNVLASSGSVVPLFESQIHSGGPVTVTHPDVTRYFMTIPEAAALVLQAGSMGTGGEVFVLDMGEQVKILDLAKTMINLSGRTVRDERDNRDGSIAITFTGLRPGEKVFEELTIGDNVGPTAHPAILCAQEQFLPWPQVEQLLQSLDAMVSQHDRSGVRKLLASSVEGYECGTAGQPKHGRHGYARGNERSA